MVNPVLEQLKYCTVLIENEEGRLGTGFLVNRIVSGTKSKVFLVTNKHVLGKKRELSTKVTLHFNAEEAGVIRAHVIVFNWRLEACPWREHPDKDTDVLALEVTEILIKMPNLSFKFLDYSNFVDATILKNEEITMGEQVWVAGYPLGLKHQTTNFPLMRIAVISTNIGEKLDIATVESGVTRQRLNLRGFIIDGGASPGSSGSPIMSGASPIRYSKDGSIALGTGPVYLLGIVAEGRIATVESERSDYLSLSGLSLAFDADTIRETIELFFQGNA